MDATIKIYPELANEEENNFKFINDDINLVTLTTDLHCSFRKFRFIMDQP